ncbi:MAG: tape measure protein [Bifidobacterium sp.]|uniref:Tape measure protein n=1 Tax=Bifidobacterium fermentum TaxID=3059035 RepID=A0AB39UEE9_9BIFI
MAYELAQAYVAIVPSMAGVGKAISKAFGDASAKAGANGGAVSGKGFSTGFATKMGAISGLVSSAVSKAASVVSSSLSGAISRVDTINNFPKVMKNLGYSASDSAKQIQRMSDKLIGLPTSLDSMVGMVQKLAPLTKNLKSATDISLAFNDALLAGGKSTQMQSDAMEQYSQMLSLNKVDLTAWRSVSNAMPGQMDQLAKSILGTKAKSLDLYEAMKDGTVTFDQFNAAVLKLDKSGYAGFASFSQQAKDATQGIGTAMTNVNTAITRGVANVINAFGASTIAGAINGFGARITAASNWVSDFVKQTMATGAVQTFANALASVGKAAIGVIQPIGQALANLLGFNSQMVTSQGAAAAFSGVLDRASSALQQVSTFVKDNSQWIQPLIAGITAATGAVKLWTTAQTIYNAAFKIAPALTKAFGNVLGAFGGPVGLVIGLIAALVAGLTYFFTQTKTGQKAWQSFAKVLSGLWTQVQGVWNSILPSLEGLVSSFGSTLQSIATAVMPVVSAALGALGPMFSQLMAPITANLPALESAFGQLGKAFMQVVQALLPVFSQFVSTMSSLFTQLMPVFAQLASTVGTAIGEIVTALAPVIATVVTAIAAIIGVVAPLIAVLISDLLPIVGQIIGVVVGLIAAIAPFITMLIGMLIPVITAIVNVVTALLPIVTSVITAIFAVLTPIITAIVGIIQGVLTVLQGVINYIVGAFTGNWSQAWQGIQQIFSGVWKAISSLFTGVWNALTAAIGGGLNVIRTIWSSAWNGIKTFFSSIWNGIKNAAVTGISNVIGTISGIKGRITGFFSGAGSWLTGAGKAILSGLLGGLKNAWKDVTSFIGGIGDWIKEHKGPLSYDAKLLIPAGNVIMQGFGSSLEKSFRANVAPFVSGVNGQLAAMVGSTGVNAQMSANAKSYSTGPAAGLVAGVGAANVVQNFSITNKGVVNPYVNGNILGRTAASSARSSLMGA